MRIFLASLVVLLSFVNVPAAVASPEGQMSFALQVSLAPVWFDPAETTRPPSRSSCSTLCTTRW